MQGQLGIEEIRALAAAECQRLGKNPMGLTIRILLLHLGMPAWHQLSAGQLQHLIQELRPLQPDKVLVRGRAGDGRAAWLEQHELIRELIARVELLESYFFEKEPKAVDR